MKIEIPPILCDIEQELREYLINPERLPIHEYERNQEHWPRTIDLSSLFVFENSPLSTTLKVQRDYNTGEITEFCEVSIDNACASAKNSMSLTRAPTAPEEVLWGSISNFPFLPGSFTDPLEQLKYQSPSDELKTEELLFVPPGFDKGLIFEADGVTVKGATENYSAEKPSQPDTGNLIDLLDIIEQEQDFLKLWDKEEKQPEVSKSEEQQQLASLPEEEEVLKEEVVLNISSTVTRKPQQDTEWAVLLDTSKPVTNFREKIPELAHQFPFKLDTFQELAILQLEAHNHVLVAAHTSAGKTVVAEYAIALSQKHMTRTIYTSPIKALSNQKYRDFKRTFKDVGLITGDFQINQTAPCLIMTTEILRSMLYRGSDITRDLEYVIFDEVHYINDKERGHVWEQVLIMLPPHVCVVLLSATVPNTMEFADWLGRTHQRKVYVIKTDKRPVPLQHYLYTGCGGKTRNNRFLILNENGKFINDGYYKAVESLKSKEEKSSKPQTPNQKYPVKKEQYQSNIKGYTPKQEKTMWEGLVDHLSKNDLLPAVAFTFSRARCDRNAELLCSLDLTSVKEKFHIEIFFNKCISSLKETDREIPQVIKMRDTLIRGIGVHHSGILPIIKEMVEMLFQGGFVKLLFATETFAMGVNMPTRTVVFDSVEKHDGRSLRSLLPAEYIQMAGRAGRRIFDKTGTVIIICKKEVPPLHILQTMMTGKPNQLISQFRLTYGMVLSLLRVESLSVEGMMSKSFREADHEKRKEVAKEELKRVEMELKERSSRELSEYLQPLIEFYNCASRYLQHKQSIFPKFLKSHQVAKEVTVGRVVLITYKSHVNKLGLILNVTPKPTDQLFKVLILDDQNSSADEQKHPDEWYKMIALATEEVFTPEGPIGHKVVQISSSDILEITSKTIKMEADLILKDWDERQIPRFRDKPPGQTCSAAIQELFKLSVGSSSKGGSEIKLNYLDFVQNLKVNDLQLAEDLHHLHKLKEKVLDHIGSTKIANFEEQFQEVFARKSLEDKRAQLLCQLSNASLSLYPDYEKRIQLLKRLKYVDSQNKVDLKGVVACEMGMHELLITELILRNTLTNLQPAVIAALLSSLVFQAKTRAELSLTKELEEGIKKIKEIHHELLSLETEYKIIDESSDNELNFGLVQVVYEWATGKPFAEIMELTDVQEGIIVRCIQQLNEIISDVKDAARHIGDPELKTKMEEASAAIKRDIVFAASLYTQKEASAI